MGGGLSALSEVILSLTEEVIVQPLFPASNLEVSSSSHATYHNGSRHAWSIRLSLRMGNRQIGSILVSEGQSYPVQVEPLEIEIIAE